MGPGSLLAHITPAQADLVGRGAPSSPGVNWFVRDSFSPPGNLCIKGFLPEGALPVVEGAVSAHVIMAGVLVSGPEMICLLPGGAEILKTYLFTPQLPRGTALSPGATQLLAYCRAAH